MHENDQKDKTYLIKVIDLVINSLNNGASFYSWNKVNCDNVGLLAQVITAQAPEDLFDKCISPLISNYPNACPHFDTIASGAAIECNWSALVRAYFPIIGEPTVPLFRLMYNIGLKPTDITDLEWLANEEILKRAQISKSNVMVDVTSYDLKGFFRKRYEYKQERKSVSYYESEDNYIKYLKAWRAMLAEQTPLTPPPIPKVFYYDDDEYPYSSLEDLQNLKENFLAKDKYEAIIKLDKEISKFEEELKNKK